MTNLGNNPFLDKNITDFEQNRNNTLCLLWTFKGNFKSDFHDNNNDNRIAEGHKKVSKYLGFKASYDQFQAGCCIHRPPHRFFI